jgi:hypothetical protein
MERERQKKNIKDKDSQSSAMQNKIGLEVYNAWLYVVIYVSIKLG